MHVCPISSLRVIRRIKNLVCLSKKEKWIILWLVHSLHMVLVIRAQYPIFNQNDTSKLESPWVKHFEGSRKIFGYHHKIET